MSIKVFKFGGASVNSASAVKNMASIVQQYGEAPLVVVVSAMGKTTNALEKLVPGICSSEDRPILMQELIDYHLSIVRQLFKMPTHPVYAKLKALFASLEAQVNSHPTSYNFDYDQTVSFGELISTTIISEYLNSANIKNSWVDIRKVITTDTTYREGHVDWAETLRRSSLIIDELNSSGTIVTQGFIAGTPDGHTTTLGREGSDYSASILSYCLDADAMTIWKDVPGFLNADPKFFQNTIKIKQIPYNEAIELAYYGASVIHPKTVKPIQNKNIALHIRSFITPESEGSKICSCRSIIPKTPLYIFKNNQVLLSIMPKDFSFIAEDNLEIIFGYLSQVGIKVNVMQNSALSFSVCIDDNQVLLNKLSALLKTKFKVRYNKGLQLITMRYYTEEVVDAVVDNRRVLLEQRSRTTAQLVVEPYPSDE